jgi:hypothetical protein
MWWTVLTVGLAVLVLFLIVAAPIFPGRKSYGEAEETRGRLWSGLWSREDADRFRGGKS